MWQVDSEAMDISWVTLLDYFGVFVFAISGALVAARKHLDVFGYLVLALFPAIGGGTVRDIVLDLPVFWLDSPVYLYITFVAALGVFVFANQPHTMRRALVWADALGLSMFCVIGAHKAMALDYSPTIAVIMGVVTAVFGGMIRDVIANEVPLVLKAEIYATAAFAGAIAYVIAQTFLPANVAMLTGFGVCFVTRAMAILFSWSLPVRTFRPPPTDGA